MKARRAAWTVAFLGVTALAIVMEVVAGIFHPAGTIPWTEYLARYVPWPVQLIAYVALAVWLPIHFWHHDHIRQVAYQAGHDDGHAQNEKLLYDAWQIIQRATAVDDIAAGAWRDAYRAHLGPAPERKNS